MLSIGCAVRPILLCFCICYSGIATQTQTSQQGLSFGMISVSPAFGYSRRHTSICVNLWSVFPLIALESVTFLLLYFSPLVGTEELGHLEMVGTLVHQLTRNLSEDQIRTAGFDAYFVDHTTGVYPQFASGYPWSASTMQVTGDIIADLTEDLAADGAMMQEQRGRKPLKTLDCGLDKPFPAALM